MSGARATFTLKSGKTFDEAVIATALEKKGMKLESFQMMRRSRPALAWVYDVEGLG